MLPVHKAVTVHGTPMKVMPRVKICAKCKFFNKTTTTCERFTNIDLVTGQEVPMIAYHARDNNSLCGVGGSYYEVRVVNQESQQK